MANIACDAVKESKPLRTPQNAIWCGMWVVSLGLLLIAGLDILATYGWSLNSLVVVGAIGLGPLLALTMLCGFNVSEVPKRDAFDNAARAQAGRFRQANLFHPARRQLKWNSLVRPSVLARSIPFEGRHLPPDCDHDGQRHHLRQPYRPGTVLKMAFQAPIVALASIASSADVANAWPSGIEPASAMYWCATAAELNTKNAFTVWVDKTSGGREPFTQWGEIAGICRAAGWKPRRQCWVCRQQGEGGLFFDAWRC